MSQAAAKGARPPLGAALPVTPTQTTQRPADGDRTPTVARMGFTPRTLLAPPVSTLAPTPGARGESGDGKSTDIDQDRKSVV